MPAAQIAAICCFVYKINKLLTSGPKIIMTEADSLKLISEWEEICLEASENQAGSKKKMAEKMFAVGTQQSLPDNLRAECIANLDMVLEVWHGKPFSSEAEAMLETAMALAWDSPILRDRYAVLSKQVFARYGNPAGLSDVMQFRDDKVDIEKIYRRWKIMQSLKVGAYCYDPAFGPGKIVAIDNLANEVTLNLDRKRLVYLRNFLDNIILVKTPSKLNTLLENRTFTDTISKKELLASLEADLLSASPIAKGTMQKLLVPAYFSAADLTDSLIAGKTGTNPAEGDAATMPDARRWDVSRSIVELAERLKDLTKLEVENPQLENVKKILASVAARPEQSEFFAASVALLQKGEAYNEFLEETLAELANSTAVWNSVGQFVEICDKMPSKLVFYWMKATLLAKGSEFLVGATMRMPYRLWTNTDKLLTAAGQDEALAESVFQAFQNKKVTPEHFYWLWKAPDSEERLQHLSNVNLLFKTLHVEVKGSYLKSQRLLRKMLVDDEKFQRSILRFGDMAAIKALVRCIRHQPLLDNSERQSLLVKIVRHFPEAVREVEEKRKGPAHRSGGKISSLRSLDRSKKELLDLIDVQIPENIAAIEFARSLGDLRENSEFKFAKERQAFLAKRRAELEERSSETMVLDFSKTAVVNTVVPGCSVTIKYDSGTLEKFYILGRLDSDPDKNMISYETPLGEVLLGVKIGTKVKMPSGDAAIVVAIEKLPADLLDWLNSTDDREWQ